PAGGRSAVYPCCRDSSQPQESGVRIRESGKKKPRVPVAWGRIRLLCTESRILNPDPGSYRWHIEQFVIVTASRTRFCSFSTAPRSCWLVGRCLPMSGFGLLSGFCDANGKSSAFQTGGLPSASNFSGL